MSDTLIVGFASIGAVILISVFGFAFRRISRNSDCIENEVKNFTDHLDALETQFSKEINKFQIQVCGSLEGLRTDITWIKTILTRLENRTNRINPTPKARDNVSKSNSEEI